jgi:5-methylcytosine-specific restriction endonuclease McrA
MAERTKKGTVKKSKTAGSGKNTKKNTKKVSKVVRLAVYIRDRFTCQACGTDLRHMMACCVTLDHLVPRSEGGNNEGDNLATLCWDCNTSRGIRPWKEFYPGGAIKRLEVARMEKLNIGLAQALIDGTAGDEELEAIR